MTQELFQGDLFDPTPFRTAASAAPADPYAGMGADARRTARQLAAMSGGLHPLSLIEPTLRLHPAAPIAADGDPLRQFGRRCGNCVHRLLVDLPRVDHPSSSTHPKCTRGWDPEDGTEAYTAPLVTRSAATDVRKWWPGCERHEHAADGLLAGGPAELELAGELYAADRIAPPEAFHALQDARTAVLSELTSLTSEGDER